jgi:peroxiredoxin
MFYILYFFLSALLLSGAEAKVGQPAPDFTLTNIDGKQITLHNFTGKWVVLEWINYDCPFVRKHYSAGNMQNLQKTYTEKGVVWLSINSSSPGKQGHFTAAEIHARMSSHKAYNSDYLLDPEGTVGKAFGAKTTPHIFIIDPQGKLIYTGGIDSIRSADPDDIPKATNYVREVLEAVLAGRPSPFSSTESYGCSVKYK